MAEQIDLKKEFWRIVKECLIHFHDQTKEQASDLLVKALIDADQTKFYEDEPFYVANSLIGKELGMDNKICYTYERFFTLPEWSCHTCSGSGTDQVTWPSGTISIRCTECSGTGNRLFSNENEFAKINGD